MFVYASLLRIGNGGRNNVLRIPGADGYPDCGTEQVLYMYTSYSVEWKCAPKTIVKLNSSHFLED